jgi:DnaJ homolog subfamily C member 19
MTKAILAALIIGAIYYLFFKPRAKPQVKPQVKPGAPRMAEDEARAILGIGDDADEEAIRGAHRRLVSAVHPDKGGSEELTRRINAARDTLLRRGA